MKNSIINLKVQHSRHIQWLKFSVLLNSETQKEFYENQWNLINTIQTFKNKRNLNINWLKCTNPDFQDHRIDDAANDGDKIEHVPRIFEEILHSIIESRENKKQILEIWIFELNRMGDSTFFSGPHFLNIKLIFILLLPSPVSPIFSFWFECSINFFTFIAHSARNPQKLFYILLSYANILVLLTN